MQTIGKNVRRILIKLFYGFLILLAVSALLFILPNSIGVKVLFLIAISEKWIGYTILIVVGLWALYWLFKEKQKVKRKSITALFTVAIGYAFICVMSFFHQSTYEDCDYHTKLLNGGIKEFKGKKYTINMCGTKFFWGNGYQVRLQVIDDMGELRALRYFTFYWNDVSDKELQYGDDVILYYDKSDDDALKSIKMPPSKIDWIRARLPLFE